MSPLFSKRFIVGIVIFLAFAAVILTLVSKIFPVTDAAYLDSLHSAVLQREDREITLFYVDTPTSRLRGLSNLSELPQDTGMFFSFDTSDMYAFWMKDMLFSLDIIWLDETMTVVDITRNISPETYPETFKPKVPARYVIECGAGCAQLYNIEEGEQLVVINLPG